MTTNHPTPGDELVERLRMQARVESEAMRGMMEAKSLRQPDNSEGRSDLYLWPKPEETLPWKAADEIERLRTRDEAARSSTTEVERIRAEIINSPETTDFMAGVPIEAAHQRERWGAAHDAGKTPFDWFWLLGYLAQKAADAAVRGDVEKAKHHTISTAAVLANWHAALTGADKCMRPGLDPVEARNS